MNRKQVNTFLKIMMKDNTRPGLECGYIDLYNDRPVIVATDGYILSAVYLDDEARNHVGKRVTRDSIERWYKLADGRSLFTGDTIQQLLEEDVREGRTIPGAYPAWQTLIPSNKDFYKFKDDMTISFNADFMKLAQDLSVDNNVKVSIYGKLSPLVIESETSLTLIMPVKE